MIGLPPVLAPPGERAGDRRGRWVLDAGTDEVPDGLHDRIFYLGSVTSGRDGKPVEAVIEGPQAFLAIQGGGADLPTHFHEVDQFQLFAHGSGRVGRERVEPGVVLYADRYTPYGPLRPDEGGMSYVTMRGQHDPRVGFMPEARSRLAEVLPTAPRAPGDRRSLAVDLRDAGVSGEAGVSGAAGVSGEGRWVDALADGDGLRVAVAAVGPGEPVPPPEVGGGGAYVAVLSGSVVEEGSTLAPYCFTWCGPGGELEATAGPTGARLALLQFPA